MRVLHNSCGCRHDNNLGKLIMIPRLYCHVLVLLLQSENAKEYRLWHKDN